MTEDIKGDADTYMNFGRESIEECIPDGTCDFDASCLFCPYSNDCPEIGGTNENANL